MASEDQDSPLRFSAISTSEDLLAVQRKEKKDLIAKTQKMKHSVPKGDKKKKKEVTAEITQLLADLDLKHEAELKEFDVLQSGHEMESHRDIENLPNSELNNDQSKEKSYSSEDLLKQDSDVECQTRVTNDSGHVEESSVTNGDINVKSTQRVTKAQKRRNKKAALEKERNKAIAEQELENLSGLRHLESESIKKKLSERNLTLYEISSDGNCLYKAIEHQLSILNLPSKNFQTLREETSKYMLSHAEDYIPFLTCPETGDVFNEEMYVKYCDDIVKTSAWGGHVEIQVLSHILGYPIEIIQADSPSIIVGNEKSNPKITLSYHKHVFGLGEHYNSVIPVIE